VVKTLVADWMLLPEVQRLDFMVLRKYWGVTIHFSLEICRTDAMDISPEKLVVFFRRYYK
jgi:hypothetical protein